MDTTTRIRAYKDSEVYRLFKQLVQECVDKEIRELVKSADTDTMLRQQGRVQGLESIFNNLEKKTKR